MKKFKHLLSLSILCLFVLFTNCVGSLYGDADNDGVVDEDDTCAQTPKGATVDSNGCSDSQKDTDGDGVEDADDTCADTPSGETVDSNGCSDSQKDTDGDGVSDDDSNTVLDADGDGVADADDTCTDTPSGETVDSNGCSDSQKDTDGDGVSDDLDTCADTAEGSTVDESGCTVTFIYLDENGVTIKASENAVIGESYDLDGVSYLVVDSALLYDMVANEEDVTKIVTTNITDMQYLFQNASTFNQDISSWDV
jgi:hypothetical protein